MFASAAALLGRALQLAHCWYGDIPGNWSWNVPQTYRRAENDEVLPSA